MPPTVYVPPTVCRDDLTADSVFLAGGITNCPDWQADAINLFPSWTVLYNPRRPNFPIHDPTAAAGQVAWEFEHLAKADVVLFWFAGGESVQPIVLFELGSHARSDKPIVVGCDPTYLRRQDVVLQLGHLRPNIHVHDTLADTAAAAVATIGTIRG